MGNTFWRNSAGALKALDAPGQIQGLHGVIAQIPELLGLAVNQLNPMTRLNYARANGTATANALLGQSRRQASQLRALGLGPGLAGGALLSGANGASQAYNKALAKAADPESIAALVAQVLGLIDQQTMSPIEAMRGLAGSASAGPYHPPKKGSALDGLLGAAQKWVGRQGFALP